MCGIVGYTGKGDASSILVEGLRKLEYRGYDSSGVAVFVAEKGIEVVKAKGRLDDLETRMNQVGKPVGHCGIGHTRWATHGEPSDINSHPHGNHLISIVHNGIIENYLELKNRLLKHGYQFESQTDTETVAKLLDYYYDGNPFDTLCKVISRLKGSYALGVVFRDFPEQIFAVRKDSPLIVGLGEGENFIASDIPAILKYTKNYYLIEENEVVTLKADQVLVQNTDGEVLEKEIFTADWDIEAAEKGGFPHFMLKEIFEQPEALMKTISPRIQDGLPVLEDCFDTQALQQCGRVHFVACGTAMHAGIVGKSLLEKFARIPATVWVASEFRYCDPILQTNDLLVIISQSGETADSLAALRLAKERGICTLALVNVVGSSIAREADHVLYTWAGPEIAVASTKAYTVQVALLYLFAFHVALLKETVTTTQIQSICTELLSLPEQMKQVLDHAEQCQFIASRFQNSNDLFFIGRGLDYALSEEGSLKLKEISYIHSEAYAAGELKHGTISLITDDVPVVAIATQQALFEKMCSNIKEVTTRGAKVLLITEETFVVDDSIADYILRIPHLTDSSLLPLLTIIPLQLFSYYMAVLRGCDVDKPRNLAKSVTVE